MISVIVPVYKVEKYLRKCVESIQNQTYTDIEIILIDDGSPDECGKICDELAVMDTRIKVIHQKNGGQAAARNSGLEVALNGRKPNNNHYIAFVDSDDTIDCNMFQILINMMSDNVDLAICGHRIVLENKLLEEILVTHQWNKLSIDELWEEVFGRLNNAVWNKLYKAELIDDLRFPTGLIHGEDLIFNLQYLCRCNEGAINGTPLYNYLKREGSVTTGSFNSRKLMEISSKDKAKEIVEKHYPKLVPAADVFCFRARMNVIRGIYKSKQENQYYKELMTCQLYVKTHIKQLKGSLKKKEVIEYILLKYVFWLYRFLIKKD